MLTNLLQIKNRVSIKGLSVSLLILLCLENNIFSQAIGFPVKNGMELSPRLLDNLMFLNNMDKEPMSAEKQMLYKWAETGLVREQSGGVSLLAEYDHFQAFCEENDIIHLGGPMLGNISENGVDVWVRSSKPASIKVVVDVDGQKKTFGPISSTMESELSAVVSVTGLKPSTEYAYRVYVDDVEIPIPDSGSFRTTSSDKGYSTRLTFGSCLHRWGFANQNQTNTMLRRKPDAFLLLGDISAQDKLNHTGWHSLDYIARDMYPAWKKLSSKIPIYAAWDDHDYFGDDLWGIPEGYTDKDRANVWGVFRTSWVNPSYGFGDQEKGVFLKTQIGSIDVIMLDNRYFRTKDSFLGEGQTEWLKQQLLDSKAPFKVISCGSMFSDYVSNGKDSWGTFEPEAREEIFSLIEKNNISGVILISGDRHGARGFKIPRKNGFNFYEFEAASLGGLAGPKLSDPSWDTQLFGIGGKYAFGELTFNLKPKDPVATFRLVGEDGDILYELSLKKSELTPGNYK